MNGFTKHRARVIIGAIVTLSTVFVAGCAGHGAPDSGPPDLGLLSASMPTMCTKGAGPVVLVVSGREDRPAPVVTGMMQAAVETAVDEGSAIGLVDLDGRPRLIAAGAFSDAGANSVALQAAQQQYAGSLTSAIERTRAVYPHADVLDALNVAGQAIRAACAYGGTIFLEDSGLQETGLVNFTLPAMLGAAPADVASYLARQGDLPALAGMTLVLVGAGDTSPPQLPLSISQRSDVIAIWTAIARAGGATVRVDPAPISGPAPGHVPSVALVPVPAAASWTPSSGPRFVFPDSGSVGFEPNTAVFRDPAAAYAALRHLASYLAGNPSARIELTGTTARWGTFAWDLRLATERAQTVKAALVDMGAGPGQIATQGLGWQFPGYINDQGPDGTLLPGPAEHNRSVEVTKI